MSGQGVEWSVREPPLAPRAAAALGSAARALGARLLELDDEALRKLTGVVGPESIVILGDEADLPWVDGVVYLGRDDEAPSLLLPTHSRPSAPGPGVFARAVHRRFSRLPPPLAVLPEAAAVVSCAGALRVSRARLEAWLRESAG